MPQAFKNREESNKGKYPPTFKLDENGQTVVGFALKVREVDMVWEDPPRKSIVVECVLRGKPEAEQYTIWWPKNLNLPPVFRPFMLTRKSKRDYEVMVGASDDEDKSLWNEGKFPENGAPVTEGNSAAAALAKLVGHSKT